MTAVGLPHSLLPLPRKGSLMGTSEREPRFHCSDCGVGMDRISYVEPELLGSSTTGYYSVGVVSLPKRPPLCKPCWEKHYAKVAGGHQ